MSRPRLESHVPVDQLYPANSAFVARADLAQTRMLGFSPFNRESVTTLMFGLMGSKPAVRHISAMTESSLKLLQRAGLVTQEDTRIYETGEQAEQHAQDLIEEGFKLIWPYPPEAGRWPRDCHLVRPDLWADLNAKKNLEALVGAENLPAREIPSTEDFANSRYKDPVFVKYAGGLATGWGYGVHFCDSEKKHAEAKNWFQQYAAADHVVVEQSVNVAHCWCINIAVAESGSVLCGGAEQVFSGPGQQSGNVVDSTWPVPQAAIDIALRASEAARARGFLGLCGFDVGVDIDGRYYAFDPNFRFNACSAQVLFHDSATRHSGYTFSQSVAVKSALPIEKLETVLRGPVDDNWLVPMRLIDGKLLCSGDGLSTVTGFIMAEDQSEATRRSLQLTGLLKG